MNEDEDDLFEDDDDEDDIDIKAFRARRFVNKKKDAKRGEHEPRMRLEKPKRRPKFTYDPDWDEDDYEGMDC